jgi:hypothetical protein
MQGKEREGNSLYHSHQEDHPRLNKSRMREQKRKYERWKGIGQIIEERIWNGIWQNKIKMSWERKEGTGWDPFTS